MSTETIYKCDRCYKEVRKDRSGWMILRESYTDRAWELCYDCKEKFLAFLRMN